MTKKTSKIPIFYMIFFIIGDPLKLYIYLLIKILLPQLVGQYCCAHSTQISERSDENWDSLFDLKKKGLRRADGRTDRQTPDGSASDKHRWLCQKRIWNRNTHYEITTVALKGHHYISFSLHYINFDLCEKNIMWLCIHNYLACIHNYLACIHKYLACIHNYLACIHD